MQECDVQIWGEVSSFGYYFVRSLGISAGEDDVTWFMLCETEYRGLANTSGACNDQRCCSWTQDCDTPPVTNMFLPARLGMSVSGLNCTPLGLIARPDMIDDNDEVWMPFSN